ncbi:MAG: hypothetical protein HW418_1660 [Anaerolineales bacterium]|jgi:hypothetical protein|nr:hypothetical protein [Anaerolineales bacterium]
MKTVLRMIGAVALVVVLASPASPAAAQPVVTFTLLTELPTQLAVGQSHTIQVQVTSDEPFLMAMAMPDTYYPGRGIFIHGIDIALHTTEAVLLLEVTGKASTADLPAVQDWPATEDWPAGVAPASVVVGVRFQNGQVVSQRFNFAVAVP